MFLRSLCALCFGTVLWLHPFQVSAATRTAIPLDGAPGAWTLETQQGATGVWRLETAADGQVEAVLEKTNSIGYLVLRPQQPLALKPGEAYRFRGQYHSSDAPLTSLLLFRVGDPTRPPAYDSIDRSFGWTSQSQIINSPADAWETRVMRHQAEEGRAAFPMIVLYGNPVSVRLRNLELVHGAEELGRNPGGTPTVTATEAQVRAHLETRPMADARLVRQADRMALQVSGTIEKPVLYKDGLYVGRADHHHFGQEAGVGLSIVPVRLGMSQNRPGVWLGHKQYDFAALEQAIMDTLRQNPDARLVLDLWIYPYQQWGTDHPEECWIDTEGRRGYGWWGNLTGFTTDLAEVDTAARQHWFYPSYQSERWQADASEAIADLIGHLRTTPLWKPVVGLFITGGHDGQFQTMNRYDRSPATLVAFRDWSRQRYATIADLNAIWRSSYTRFEEIDLPAIVDHGRGQEAAPPYLTASAFHDYRLFLTERAWLLRDHFAGVGKQAAGKDVLTIAYGNPLLYRFRQFMQLEHLDAASSMSVYPYRNPGQALGYLQESSFAQHDKLFIQEIDLRSWTGAPYSLGEGYLRWIGAGLTPERWEAIHRKMVGFSLAGNHGYWYYDMNWYYNDPRILESIGRTSRIVDRYWSAPRGTFRPEVAVILRDESEQYVGAFHSSLLTGLTYQHMLLETSGVPFEVHYLEDLLKNPQLQRHKVYVFLQANFMTSEERHQIKEQLQRDGRTLVWMNDAGYVSEEGLSTEAMSDLFGMQVATQPRYDRRTALLAGEAGHPWTAGELPFQGMSELVSAMMRLEGPNAYNARPQPFWIQDERATPLAHYHEDGRVAAAVRRFPTWTSLYLAAPNSLGSRMFQNIAREAGAYVVGEPGQSIFMNENFLSLHGLKSSPYTITPPPGRSRVIDADTGRVLAENGASWTWPVEAQKTYWFFFE